MLKTLEEGLLFTEISFCNTIIPLWEEAVEKHRQENDGEVDLVLEVYKVIKELESKAESIDPPSEEHTPWEQEGYHDFLSNCTEEEFEAYLESGLDDWDFDATDNSDLIELLEV